MHYLFEQCNYCAAQRDIALLANFVLIFTSGYFYITPFYLPKIGIRIVVGGKELSESKVMISRNGIVNPLFYVLKLDTPQGHP